MGIQTLWHTGSLLNIQFNENFETMERDQDDKFNDREKYIFVQYNVYDIENVNS